MEKRFVAISSGLSETSARAALTIQILDETRVACANIRDPACSLMTSQGGPGEAEEAGVLFDIDAAWRKHTVAQWLESQAC
jgi:hypothetical protein